MEIPVLTKFQNVLLGAALALILIAPTFAHAGRDSGPRLYADSQLVVRDRFSDEIIGNGPDIVFIPGLASSRDTWKAEAERLKDHYRVHLINVAGFAGEPARANANGPVFVPTAEALDAYLVEQHLAPAIVIGHSLGGTMVLYLAEKHGADIKKGLIVDALPFYGALMGGPTATVQSIEPIADKVRANPQGVFAEPKYSQMLKAMTVSANDQTLIRAWGKESDAKTLVDAMADDMTLDLRPGLASITVPLTLVYPDYAQNGMPKGTADAMYRGSYAADKTMAFDPVTDSLHFVMLDEPTQMDAALDAFLAN